MEPAMILRDFRGFSPMFRHFFVPKNSIENVFLNPWESQVTQWNTSGPKLMAASPPCHPLAVSFFPCLFLLCFLETSNFSK